jgi:hypothetical protein
VVGEIKDYALTVLLKLAISESIDGTLFNVKQGRKKKRKKFEFS